MSDAHRIDAYCSSCEDTVKHLVEDDEGSCVCVQCGTVQQTYAFPA